MVRVRESVCVRGAMSGPLNREERKKETRTENPLKYVRADEGSARPPIIQPQRPPSRLLKHETHWHCGGRNRMDRGESG